MNEPARLELLSFDHAQALERFERTNREFFAEHVGDRGDDFFEHFDDVLAARVRENHERVSLLFVILDDNDEVLGRVNVTDIDQPELTELGFRVADEAQGRHIASEGVKAALEIAAAAGVRAVTARVSCDNSASQRVLQRCGFEQVGPTDAPPGAKEPFIGFRADLRAR